jgi:predicted nucleotidyltransferase component of viral defense system
MNKPKDIAASVSARLSNYARDQNYTYQEVLLYYAIERFLYRLAQSKYRDTFVLKGGVVFFAWRIPLRRATRDIDLHGRGSSSVKYLEAVIKEICEQTVQPDGMLFDTSSVTGTIIQDRAEYQGLRIRFTGYLGTARAPMQIDIGFSDVIVPSAIKVDYPTILDMPEPHLHAYSWETLIAEKFQAMVFLGSINSRMKDFYDVWLLTYKAAIDGSILQMAIMTIFNNRSTPLPDGLPVALSQSFAKERRRHWQAFISREKIEAGEAVNFLEVILRLNDFLFPIVDAVQKKVQFKAIWNPAKGWFYS